MTHIVKTKGSEDVPKSERYELVSMGDGQRFHMKTNAWADRLRFLFNEHVKHLDPQYGWKGACEAVVPKTLAADVREAMNFVGALVDYEQDMGDEGLVLIHSEGYYVHIGA
jgi:hypothetical protein